jgi:hypothetical protein
MRCIALIVAVVLMSIAAIAHEKHKVPNRKVLQAFGKLDKALAVEAESLQKIIRRNKHKRFFLFKKTVADVVAWMNAGCSRRANAWPSTAS